MKKSFLSIITLILLFACLPGCEDGVDERNFYPSPYVIFQADTLRLDLNTQMDTEIVVKVRTLQGLTALSYSYGIFETVNGKEEETILESKEMNPGGSKDTVFINFTPQYTLDTYFVDVTATDSWGYVTQKRMLIETRIGPAPEIIFPYDIMVVDLDEDEDPEVVIDIKTTQGIVKVEYGCIVMQLVDGQMVETSVKYGDLEPNINDRTVKVKFTPEYDANIRFIEVRAEDKWGQHTYGRMPVQTNIGPAPEIALDEEFLPENISSLASFDISGLVETEVGLSKFVVTIYRGELNDPSTWVSEMFREIDDFQDRNRYEFRFTIDNTQNIVRIVYQVTDRRGQLSTSTMDMILEKPLVWQPEYQLYGIRNRKSSAAVYSITTGTGYIYNPGEAADTSFDKDPAIAGGTIENGALCDFMIWAPVINVGKYELWSPYAAAGGAAGGITSYFAKNGPFWERLNNTWFKKLGNINPANGTDGNPVEPKIVFEDLTYADLMAVEPGVADPIEGGKLTISDTRTDAQIAAGEDGNGIKNGDIIFIYTDPEKLYEPGKRAIMLVVEVAERNDPENRTDTRLKFRILTHE